MFRFMRRLLPFRWRRWHTVIGGLLVLVMPLGAVAALRGYSAWAARNQIYTLETVPERPVAIIFGAWVIANERPSAMLADRIKMGAELYHSGKAKVLLLTGDNHIDSYNEPEAMRQYALSLGVPDDALVLDYAGFRTYDSCFRARDVFKVTQAILVTQAFHLDRALLTCGGLGIDAVGVAADMMRPTGYYWRSLLVSELREYPSTALSVLDLLRGKQPLFLGDPLPIVVNHFNETH